MNEQPSNPNEIMKLVAKLGEIDQSKIDDFRTTAITKELLSKFDRLSDDNKIKCAALHVMSDEEISQLRLHNNLPGFHDINNLLWGMFLLTGNERYLKDNNSRQG